MVQWLGLHAFTVEGPVQSLVWELRSHKLRGTAKKKINKIKLGGRYKALYYQFYK